MLFSKSKIASLRESILVLKTFIGHQSSIKDNSPRDHKTILFDAIPAIVFATILFGIGETIIRIVDEHDQSSLPGSLSMEHDSAHLLRACITIEVMHVSLISDMIDNLTCRFSGDARWVFGVIHFENGNLLDVIKMLWTSCPTLIPNALFLTILQQVSRIHLSLIFFA